MTTKKRVKENRHIRVIQQPDIAGAVRIQFEGIPFRQSDTCAVRVRYFPAGALLDIASLHFYLQTFRLARWTLEEFAEWVRDDIAQAVSPRYLTVTAQMDLPTTPPTRICAMAGDTT